MYVHNSNKQREGYQKLRLKPVSMTLRRRQTAQLTDNCMASINKDKNSDLNISTGHHFSKQWVITWANVNSEASLERDRFHPRKHKSLPSHQNTSG